MRYVVFGAGSIGTAIGAALAAAGREAVLVARPGRVAAITGRGGARVVTEAGTRLVPLQAVTAIGGLERGAGDVLLLTVKNRDVRAALGEIVRWGGPSLPLISFLNGVRSEGRAARRLERVYGAVARFTVWSGEPGGVIYRRPGSFVLGLHPEGIDELAQEVAADLRAAGFEVGLSPRIREDKWLKLLVNLLNPPEALIRREEENRRRLHRLEAALLEEGCLVLRAAGIVAAPAGGVGRPPEEMVAVVREGRWGNSAAPGFPRPRNSTWQNLERGSPLEDGFWTGEIVKLGRRHGVPTPLNEAMLRLLRRAGRRGLGPQALTLREVLRHIRRRRRREAGGEGGPDPTIPCPRDHGSVQ